MKKSIIGILPTIKLGKNDNPYEDIYTFINNYSSRIIEQGAIPVGLLLKDGNLDKDILEICDGFLLPGGNKMYKVHYELLEYAFQNNKPVLGVCLGMQAINCYDRLKQISLSKSIEPTADNLMALRKKLQEDNIYMLEELESGHIHGEQIQKEMIEITRENILKSTHSITINPNTELYKIFSKETEQIVSLHCYRIYECSDNFIVSATAEDGTIEAIEYNGDKRWMIGVQFHPELDPNNPIWRAFVTEVTKRKKED